MASKASASAKAGGGAGTSVGGGGVKSTQTPVFGSRVAKTRTPKGRSGRR